MATKKKTATKKATGRRSKSPIRSSVIQWDKGTITHHLRGPDGRTSETRTLAFTENTLGQTLAELHRLGLVVDQTTKGASK